MDRDFILSEIRRAAAENGGGSLGRLRFEELTGIRESAWRGRHWAKWAEATAAAGVESGQMTETMSDELLLTCLANLTLEVGHFPTSSEVKLARTRDRKFPSDKVFDRLGGRSVKIELLRSFVTDSPSYASVADLLPASEPQQANAPIEKLDGPQLGDGFVYMMRLGRAYKIGKTFSVPRRHREITLELPQKPDVVHTIRTDDPDGIEAYWHRRFEAKRTNGEWFALDATDLRAFKRRRFM